MRCLNKLRTTAPTKGNTKDVAALLETVKGQQQHSFQSLAVLRSGMETLANTIRDCLQSNCDSRVRFITES